MSQPRALSLALLQCGLLAGCFYSFDNPVDQPQDGVILGQCQLVDPLAGQTVRGGSTSMLFSALQVPLDSSGKFVFVGLPSGTYALTCSVPVATSGDFPLVAERPDVFLPVAVSPTGSDSVDIGSISIAATGIVGGTVAGALGPATIAAFVPASDGGLGGYEGISGTVDATTGAFQIALPPGNHILAAADPSQSASALIAVQGGAMQSQNLTLVTAGAVPASLDGLLVLDGPGLGAGASASSLAVLLEGVSYAITDPAGNMIASGDFLADGGPTDGHFHFVVPIDSPIVSLTLSLSGATFHDPADHLSNLTLNGLPVIAGQSTQLLPQVTWIDDGDLAANASDAGSLGDGGNASGWIVVAGPYGFPDAGLGAGELFPVAGGRLLAGVGAPLSPNANPSVYGNSDLYFGLQTSAGLSNVQWLTDAGGFFQSSLSGAEQNGDVLLAWGSNYGFATSYTAALGLALIQNGGEVAWPSVGPGLSPQISYFGESTTTFPGTLGSTPGFFTVVPELDTGAFDAVFVDPALAGNQTAPVLRLVADAGFSSSINVVGTSCAVAELSGAVGFCLAASQFDSAGLLHGVLLSVATADGDATVVGVSDLGPLQQGSLGGNPSSAGIGLAADPSGQVLATFDPQELGGDDNSYSTTLLVAGPFTTLAEAPPVAEIVAPYTVTLLLPDPAGFLGMGSVTADPASGVGALLFGLDGGVTPPETLPPLAAASAEDPESMQAYRDPDSGVPTFAVQVTAGAISVVQLGGVP